MPIEVAHRWEDLPDLPDAELVKVPGHGVTLGGYFFKPQAGKPPYPAVILLHGFAGHAYQLAALARLTAANGYAVLALSLRGWLGSEGENDQGLRQPLDVLAAIDWLAKRPLVDRERIGAGRRLDGRPGGAARRRAPAADPRRRLLFRADRPRALARGQSLRARLSRRSVRARGPAGALADLPRGADRRAGAADPRRQDENVSVQQTIAMAESLKSHGKDVETFIVPGATHYFTEQQNADARRRLFDFLRRHLNRQADRIGTVAKQKEDVVR